MKRAIVPTLSELRSTKRRVCWRQDIAVPHESLWSRLRKFGKLNGTYGRELMALFTDPNKPRERSYDAGVPIEDLRAAATLNHDELSALSVGVPARLLGVIGDYIPSAARSRYCLNVWAADELKFCPDCLTHGIHVTYFQLHFVLGCPVHKRPLETKCPRCDRGIPYEPPRTAKDLAFRCNCGHVFWRWEDRPVPRLMPPRVSDGLRAAGEWVRRLTPHIQRLHYAVTEFISDPSCTEDPMLGFKQLATFFALALPQYGKLPGSYSAKARHKYRRTWYLVPRTVAPRRGRAREKELTAIYKSICRHLYRRRLRGHRRAIRIIIEDSGDTLQPPHMELYWRHPFAHAANAFLLWRSFWEGISCARDLFKKHDPVQRHQYFYTHYRWREVLMDRYEEQFGAVCRDLPSEVQPGVEIRWFASCCYTSYLTFIARVVTAFDARSQTHYRMFRRISTANFESLLTPIMLPVVVDQGLVELHWFDTSVRAQRNCEKWIDRVPTRREMDKYEEAVDRAERYLLERASRTTR